MALWRRWVTVITIMVAVITIIVTTNTMVGTAALSPLVFEPKDHRHGHQHRRHPTNGITTSVPHQTLPRVWCLLGVGGSYRTGRN